MSRGVPPQGHLARLAARADPHAPGRLVPRLAARFEASAEPDTAVLDINNMAAPDTSVLDIDKQAPMTAAAVPGPALPSQPSVPPANPVRQPDPSPRVGGTSRRADNDGLAGKESASAVPVALAAPRAGAPPSMQRLTIGPPLAPLTARSIPLADAGWPPRVMAIQNGTRTPPALSAPVPTAAPAPAVPNDVPVPGAASTPRVTTPHPTASAGSPRRPLPPRPKGTIAAAMARPPAETVVRIEIGRVEVRAATGVTARPAAPHVPEPSRLDAYLGGRRGPR
jgi:hypothetical protein